MVSRYGRGAPSYACTSSQYTVPPAGSAATRYSRAASAYSVQHKPIGAAKYRRGREVDPLSQRLVRPARPPIAPPPSALVGPGAREYVRHMRKVWQGVQPSTLSSAERCLLAHRATLDGIRSREESAGTISLYMCM